VPALDPFVVHVAKLRRAPGTRWHEVRTAPFDPDGTMTPGSLADSAIAAGADAACDAVLESFPGGVMVTGTVRASWTGVCRRCATELGGDLEVPVRERFVDLADGAGGDEDPEAYPMEGDRLDLGPLVRETLLLELPLAPLCEPGCKGLCPGCGVDRNHETCGCVAAVDPRWAILGVLRNDSGIDEPAEHPPGTP
jgi:uncharacterized protein